MEPDWNYIDREKPKSWKRNLSQCHFVHHKTTWTDLDANLSLCSERPVTIFLSNNNNNNNNNIIIIIIKRN
jgi:hypothetical protein